MKALTCTLNRLGPRPDSSEGVRVELDPRAVRDPGVERLHAHLPTDHLRVVLWEAGVAVGDPLQRRRVEILEESLLLVTELRIVGAVAHGTQAQRTEADKERYWSRHRVITRAGPAGLWSQVPPLPLTDSFKWDWPFIESDVTGNRSILQSTNFHPIIL